jgi:hypothetical protein
MTRRGAWSREHARHLSPALVRNQDVDEMKLRILCLQATVTFRYFPLLSVPSVHPSLSVFVAVPVPVPVPTLSPICPRPRLCTSAPAPVPCLRPVRRSRDRADPRPASGQPLPGNPAAAAGSHDAMSCVGICTQGCTPVHCIQSSRIHRLHPLRPEQEHIFRLQCTIRHPSRQELLRRRRRRRRLRRGGRCTHPPCGAVAAGQWGVTAESCGTGGAAHAGPIRVQAGLGYRPDSDYGRTQIPAGLEYQPDSDIGRTRIPSGLGYRPDSDTGYRQLDRRQQSGLTLSGAGQDGDSASRRGRGGGRAWP